MRDFTPLSRLRDPSLRGLRNLPNPDPFAPEIARRTLVVHGESVTASLTVLVPGAVYGAPPDHGPSFPMVACAILSRNLEQTRQQKRDERDPTQHAFAEFDNPEEFVRGLMQAVDGYQTVEIPRMVGMGREVESLWCLSLLLCAQPPAKREAFAARARGAAQRLGQPRNSHKTKVQGRLSQASGKDAIGRDNPGSKPLIMRAAFAPVRARLREGDAIALRLDTRLVVMSSYLDRLYAGVALGRRGCAHRLTSAFRSKADATVSARRMERLAARYRAVRVEPFRFQLGIAADRLHCAAKKAVDGETDAMRRFLVQADASLALLQVNRRIHEVMRLLTLARKGRLALVPEQLREVSSEILEIASSVPDEAFIQMNVERMRGMVFALKEMKEKVAGSSGREDLEIAYNLGIEAYTAIGAA